MLLLNRKSQQSVHVGEDVVVRVISVFADGTVRLGFEAPKNKLILREELIQPQPSSGIGPSLDNGIDGIHPETFRKFSEDRQSCEEDH